VTSPASPSLAACRWARHALSLGAADAAVAGDTGRLDALNEAILFWNGIIEASLAKWDGDGSPLDGHDYDGQQPEEAT
jgi:hypothetical protein